MGKTDINTKLHYLGNLIMNPFNTWKTLMRKPFDKTDITKRLFYPAIIISGFAEMLGLVLDTDNSIASFPYIIVISILIMISLYVSYRASLSAMKFLFNSFNFKPKKHFAEQLLIFTLIIGYFPIAITAIFRSMMFLNLFILYVIYLFWLGTQVIPGFSKDSRQIFGILAVIFTVVIHIFMFLLILTIQEPLISWL